VSGDGADDSGLPAPGPTDGLTGPDLARAALAQAKARARDKGLQPRATLRRRAASPGAGRDARDPQLFGAAIRGLIADRGWETTTTAARVLAEWDDLVGPEIAEHCRPASLLEGELVLIAESSAWATQLRLMTKVLMSRLADQVGRDVVTSVVVRGPVQEDWRKGPRRVKGRGPRDTYG
jgi:predicted nucleic acid-binding Zn ribbon protein